MREAAFSHKAQFQKMLAEATLINRDRAALLLKCFLAQLDRLAKTGELEVTHVDRRPRFQLVELARFIEARTMKKRRVLR